MRSTGSETGAGPVSYPGGYNSGRVDLMPVVAIVAGRSLLLCGAQALRVHEGLMSSHITFGWNTSTKLPIKRGSDGVTLRKPDQDMRLFWWPSSEGCVLTEQIEKYQKPSFQICFISSIQRKRNKSWREQIYIHTLTEALFNYPLISWEAVCHVSLRSSLRICHSLEQGHRLQNHLDQDFITTLEQWATLYELCTPVFSPLHHTITAFYSEYQSSKVMKWNWKPLRLCWKLKHGVFRFQFLLVEQRQCNSYTPHLTEILQPGLCDLVSLTLVLPLVCLQPPVSTPPERHGNTPLLQEKHLFLLTVLQVVSTEKILWGWLRKEICLWCAAFYVTPGVKSC